MARTGTELFDNIFTKCLDIQQLLDGHIGHLFETRKTLEGEDIGNPLVDIEALHKGAEQFLALLLGAILTVFGGDDVNMSRSQLRSQAYVLSGRADRPGQSLRGNRQ